MLHMFTPLMHRVDARAMAYLQFALATPIVLWCGWPFFQRAVTSVRLRSPNMFTLIGLGVGASYVFSVIATVAPNVFPPSLRGAHGQPSVYFESAAAIILLVIVGQLLELRARGRTSLALRALLDLSLIHIFAIACSVTDDRKLSAKANVVVQISEKELSLIHI